VAVLGGVPGVGGAEGFLAGSVHGAATVGGLILVLAGLVSGVMNSNDDASERLLVYVVAFTIGTISASLNQIPVVGGWVAGVIGDVAIGIQGLAVGLFLMALKNRLMPAAPSSPPGQ
jgi:hypothetical protein